MIYDGMGVRIYQTGYFSATCVFSPKRSDYPISIIFVMKLMAAVNESELLIINILLSAYYH